MVALTLAVVLAPCLAWSGVAIAAAAEADPVLTFVSPAWGERVAGSVTVRLAASDTTYARVGLDYPGAEYWLKPSPVVDGMVTVSLPTWGVAWDMGFPLLAQACTGTTTDTCSGPVAAQPVVFRNPPPQIAGAPSGVLVKPGDGPLAVPVTGDGPVVELWTGDVRVGVGAPGDVEADMSRVLDGTYRLSAHWCNRSFTYLCDLGVQDAPALTVVVRRSLAATPSLQASRVSPNGDGRQDSTRVDLGLDSAAGQRFTWTLRHDGVKVAGPFAPYGSETFTGSAGHVLDLYRVLGRVLPTGKYALVYHFHGERDGHTFNKHVSRRLYVDTTPLLVREVSTSRTMIYPGTRTRVQAQISKGGGTARIEVVNGTGRVVRNLPTATVDDGSFAFTWSGRDDEGNRVKPGTYRFLIRTEDRAGNRARSQANPVQVALHR